METARVFVGIGSNIDKRANIVSAVRALREHFGKLQLSPVYESDAVGFQGDSFYNMVASFGTRRAPESVAKVLTEVERAHGRRRGRERFCARTLDLDQLLYGDLATRTDTLCLPHADITEYAFVLRPLADLAGELKHVITNKTFAQLWAEKAPAAPPLTEVSVPELFRYNDAN